MTHLFCSLGRARFVAVVLSVATFASAARAQSSTPAEDNRGPLEPSGQPGDRVVPPEQPTAPPGGPQRESTESAAPETSLPPEPPAPEPPPPEPPVDADDLGPSPGPFRQGAIRISLLVGSGESTNDTYFILGGGAGYYVLHGLELGLDYEAWLGGHPALQRLSPEARYVLWIVPTVKPYLGFFYRHTFVSGYDGLNSLGGRLGLYYAPERSRMYLGGGGVYERYLGCTDSVLGGCDEIYPEIAIGASF